MLALQLTAIFFLLLSAAFMYGPQLAVYGPRAWSEMVRNDQARFVGGCLVSGLVFVIAAPYFGGAVSSGSDAMSVVVVDVVTMSFRPI